ncbi:CD209 antigen-like protein A isoform X1 [Brachyistius frenatus]|uniref:CD209 antigen-like protein A isoform X1 n=2 Tax=Brachyistius frenatus TaxID=100188 RepID=UPI0037E924F7
MDRTLQVRDCLHMAKTRFNFNIYFSSMKESGSLNRAMDRMRGRSDKRPSCVIKSFPLIAAGWGILSLLIGLRVYFTVIMTENNRKLTAEIQQLRKSVSVTQAQWSVDTYCPKTGENDSKGRQCKACQKEWHHFQSSCYAFYNIDGPHQINWEEAQNNCTAQNADLVVIGSPMEQEFISNHSGSSWRSSGYWIGLMVETGSWKWVDGGDLTADYWIQQPDGNAHCAISVGENSPMGWRALNCNSINRWICERAALSI